MNKKMKKFLGLSFCTVLSLALVLGMQSCKDDDPVDTGSEKEEVLAAALPQYVNNTVVTTYKGMADEADLLNKALVALQTSKTDANVKAAADHWLKSRKYWELSEAFLYGAASDFGIDPHIDTWPLAKDELLAELANDSHIASMAGEDGDAWAGEYLGNGLLGYHGIEYILFKDGETKSASEISDKELIYAVAVSGDLRNQCFRLEASWAGIDNVSEDKQAKLEDLELGILMNDRISYGENMLRAGKAGSTYITIVDACEAIIEGCITIADEVAAMKIGKPHTGEDVNYIESPYSYNSKIDFEDNIESIRNAYTGGPLTNNQEVASVRSYIKSANASLDTELINAIDDAVAKIKAIPYPFAQNYTSSQAGAAVAACNNLVDVLTKVKVELTK